MLESPATDPGRAAEEMPEALRVELMPEAENLAVALTEAVLADGLGFKGPFEEFGRIAEPLLLDALGAARRDGAQIANAQLQADLIAARKERDEATRLLRVLNEETVLAGYPCGDRDRTLANVRALRSDLIALAKMYGEACWKMVQALACVQDLSANNVDLGEEAAQLRARLHEAEKGKTVDLDTAMKRGIRSWSAKLHIPVTRMMSRVLREEIHAALTPAPEANKEAGDDR